MNTPDKVIKIASDEVGYLEKSKAAYQADPNVLYDKTAGAGNDNYTKYGKEMHDIYPAVMDFPAAWCDCFVDWCFYKAYGACNAKNMIGGNFDDYTVNSSNLYKKMNAWYTTPEYADQIFFKNSTRICHTGLVEAVDDERVYTIEGNTSDKKGLIPNGGCVARKSYALNDPCIAGYGRPKYDAVTPVQTSTGMATSKYIHGVDVNERQGIIDFEKLKAAGIRFMCIRSTKKSGNPDPYFERNLMGCIRNSLDYSCFKYAYAQTADKAVQEADGVINLLGKRKMPIWYDLEDKTLIPLGLSGIEAITRAFAEECEKAGFEVGIYCDQGFYNHYISQYLKDNFQFWIARYGPNNGKLNEDYPVSAKNLVAWQYTSHGRVPGINTDVDCDVLM